MEQPMRFKMPLPDSMDAPKFKHSEPSEVRRFIQRMESLFEHAGIREAKERKKRILEYVDAQTEQEWIGFDFYESDVPWDTFTKEIKESYPEAVDDTGSVYNLDQICREHAHLSRNDTKEIHSLMRKFRAEAKKLAKVIGNGSLVDKFLGCFTPAFADVIEERLIYKYGHYKDPTRNRHKDDKYDLSEVLSVVGALVDGSSVRGSRDEVVERKGSTQDYPKGEEAEEKIAQMQDSIVTIGKQMGSIQSAMQALQNSQVDMHKAYLNTNRNNSIRLENTSPALQTLPGGSSYCFYCWGAGHRIADCEQVKSDVQEGWVILVDGRTRMPNRAPLPREPASISPHDRIAKLHDKQVGLYFGWSTDDTVETPTYSTYVNAARDTRDDMLERIQHSDSEHLGELEKGFNKVTELQCTGEH